MKKKLKFLSIVFVLIVTMSSITMAQYSAKESFNYSAGSELDLSLGSAGNGWGGGWYRENGEDSLSSISATGLNYNDLPVTVANAGNQLKVSVPGGWLASRYMRMLDQTWPNEAGKVYWMSFAFKTSEIPTGNTYYIAKLYNVLPDTLMERVAVGKGGGGTTYTCGSGWPGGTGADVSTEESVSDPVWLVVKIVCSGVTGSEGINRTYMWINPELSAEPDTNAANVKRTTNLGDGFNAVAIENGGEMLNDIFYDEIRLGTSFADVSSQYTAVREVSNNKPTTYSLSQNYPNPFNPTTNIEFSIPKASNVQLVVYNMLGQKVATLVSSFMNAGAYTVDFDASSLATGVYIYRIDAGDFSIHKKMMLMK